MLSTKALKSKRKSVPSATLPAAKPSGKVKLARVTART